MRRCSTIVAPAATEADEQLPRIQLPGTTRPSPSPTGPLYPRATVPSLASDTDNGRCCACADSHSAQHGRQYHMPLVTSSQPLARLPHLPQSG